ncbi:MAG: pullulanase-type alpha-1,6-glucosidase [Cellulomonadaceae bacterium]|nr:pullulanase-type alpha-1,6-glucosidase [Cellulomonadaceae bacterium]
MKPNAIGAIGENSAHWISEGVLLLPGPQSAGWRLCTDIGDFALIPLPHALPNQAAEYAGWSAYRPARSDGSALSRVQIEQALTGRLVAELSSRGSGRGSGRGAGAGAGHGTGAGAGAVHGALGAAGLVLSSRASLAKVKASTGVQVALLLDSLYGAAAARQRQSASGSGFGFGFEFGARVTPAGVSFALWAPTAKSVTLLIFLPSNQTDTPDARVPMLREADGTWTASSAPGETDWVGARYLYEVEVYAPTTGKIETNLVTDPYSIGLTLGSKYSVVVDLSDSQWAPPIWTNTPAPTLEHPVDHTIYELHVRDFSRDDETVPAEWRGKYLAFTCADTAGVQHLRQLKAAGMNTIHLLPTFDIASIPEDPAVQESPGDLEGYAPDSPHQQAEIEKIRNNDAWNWGYDPLHWNVPEGSYAVSATGGSRIYEYRSMVGTLHDLGYLVVADQVFNHTMAAGQKHNSILDKIVPGYYYRQCMNTGKVFDSTCCPNIATEHIMAEKLMVDSVVFWARAYKLDGFRFDLMGHHTRGNMLAVRAALDELTVERDGVCGKDIYLYGEGWNFGEVKNDALFVQARQGNLGGTGIGTFSDRLRDAVLGGTPSDQATALAQGFGTGLATPAPHSVHSFVSRAAVLESVKRTASLKQLTDNIKIGLAGNLRDYELPIHSGKMRRGDQIPYGDDFVGYADEPAEVVTYVDAHDNETLYDYLVLKLPRDLPMADRVRMNTFCLSLVTLAQTVSFWHAGTELLRSKSLDRNSFDSGDWFNYIDWTGANSGFGRGLPPAADNKERWPFEKALLADPLLKPGPSDMQAAYEAALDLLRLRFSSRLFRLGSAELIKQKVSFPLSGPKAPAGVIVMLIDDLIGPDVDPLLAGILVVFNANPKTISLKIPELVGREFELSPIQANGFDEIVKKARYSAMTGSVQVPGRSTVVLIERSGG